MKTIKSTMKTNSVCVRAFPSLSLLLLLAENRIIKIMED